VGGKNEDRIMERLSCHRGRLLAASALVASWGIAAIPQTALAQANGTDRAQQDQGASIGTADGAADHQPTSPTTPGPASGSRDETIVVTGSRVISDGFSAPTPVTVVTGEQLLTSTPTTIGEALNKLPQFANSIRPSTSQFAPESGAATQLNLRSLGAQRGLILLNGRRVNPSTAGGIVDVSILPEELVQRVDIVTGGASAAYGSDAVAGVVNFVLDTSFNGLKGSVQSGVTQRGDNGNYKVSLTGGTSIGERLHIVASGSYYKQDGIANYRDRDWFQSCAPVVIPGATPTRIRTCNVKTPLMSVGGLIVNTPSSAGNAALVGTQFLEGGTPAPFIYGSPRTGTQMVGGEGEDQGIEFQVMPELERITGFAHVDYEVSDNLSLFVDGLFGLSETTYKGTLQGFYSTTALTIYRDNAYLPASVAARMDDPNRDGSTADAINRFTLGHAFPQIGPQTNKGRSETERVTAGFTADLGAGWGLDGHYGFGTNLQTIRSIGNLTVQRLFDAGDSVVDPSSGQIVCRTTISVAHECVPLNVFGPSSASQAAVDFVRASPYGSSGSRTDERTKQHVAELVVRGSPFSTWAGELAIAAGAGYRKESVNRRVDPGSNGPKFPNGLIPRGVEFTRYISSTTGAYFLSNQQPIAGRYDLWEVFGETLIPLADDLPFARSIDLNLAGRYTDYSTSGGVTTWKAGLNWEIFDGLRLRATRSRDIRAPNLTELYATSAAGAATVTDPFALEDPTGSINPTPVVVSLATGSTDLQPEVADTFTVGGVFSPTFLPGFQVSADYYDITIDDAIGQLGLQNIVNQCFAGSTSLCSRLERDPNGNLFRVNNGYLNINELKNSGLDIEGSYRTELGNGSAGIRVIASRVFELSTLIPGSNRVDRAGQTGISGGVPKWNFNINASLTQGGFTLNINERIIGKGTYDATFVEGRDIDNNHVPAIAYTDLSMTYQLEAGNQQAELFATINNLFDQDPPRNSGSYFVFATIPTNTFLFDQIGRAFTVGARLRM
jgi:outer membrane receptor protein involved in Fe transport